MSHTPGPWYVSQKQGGKKGIHDEDGNYVAFVVLPYEIDCSQIGEESWLDAMRRIEPIQNERYKVMKENARLIAAAPDMLAILEEILPDIECRCGEAYTGRGLHESTSLCHHAKTVKAVIAKATGKEEE